MTEITIYPVQKAVALNANKQELWLLCSAYCPTVLNICVKFHGSISKGFKLESRHKFLMEITIKDVPRTVAPKIG